MSDFISVAIIDSDPESVLALRGIIQKIEGAKIIVESDNLTMGFDTVLRNKPNIVIINISEKPDWALTIVEKIANQIKDTMIFVSSDKTSLDVAVKAMRAGAREFLSRPINSEELTMAFEKATNFLLSHSSGSGSGQIYTVFSNKGGIGKTTIATNLAVSLQELTGKRVALIDLNLQLGDVTTFLDVQPSYDISYIVKNINRVDEAFLLSSMERYADYDFYILADPPYAEQAEDISSEQINTLLTVLKSVFDYVIIDTTSSFDSKTLAALDIADRILLVSMVNLPCIRNTQRCLDLFNRLNYPKEKIHLIINRYVPTDEITVEDVEDTLEQPVFWKIPNNYFTVMAAINRGVPINQIKDGGNINLNFNQLARQIAGIVEDFVQPEKEKPEKKSAFPFLQGLLKKGKTD